MNTLILYMVKVVFYQAAFYMVYTILLSNDTMYRRNRTFILFSVLVSLLLPLFTIHTRNPIEMQFFGQTLAEVLVSVNGSNVPDANNLHALPEWKSLILIIYFTGFLYFGLRLAVNLFEIYSLALRKGGKDGNILRYNGLGTAGFSAMGMIFINSDLSKEDADEIIRHEQSHLDHYHFLDILIIELIKLILWFNPFIHLFDRSLRAVHEYQADEGCLVRGIPVISYQQILVNQVFNTRVFNITNNFSNSTLIKKRMIMMTKKRSKALANLKLLMVLPAIAIVMIAFSSCGEKVKNADISAGKLVALDENAKVVRGEPIPESAPPPPPLPKAGQNVTGPEPLDVVDEMPVFLGGEQAIIDYIRINTIYPKNARKNGIQGKVIVKFEVRADGSVGQIRILAGADPELDAEAMRVITLLPNFEKPGMKDGKPVAVWYNLPIVFKLQ